MTVTYGASKMLCAAAKNNAKSKNSSEFSVVNFLADHLTCECSRRHPVIFSLSYSLDTFRSLFSLNLLIEKNHATDCNRSRLTLKKKTNFS
jgi:hypothetical protein